MRFLHMAKAREGALKMMKNFLALFQKGKRPDTEAKDEVAKLLQTNPEALSQFESAYKQLALDVEQEGTFSTNSRQAAEKAHTIPGEAGQNPYTEDEMSTAEDMTEQIVQELLAQTTVYSFDGDLTQKVIPPRPALPDGAPGVIVMFHARELRCTQTLLGESVANALPYGGASNCEGFPGWHFRMPGAQRWPRSSRPATSAIHCQQILSS